MKLALYGLMAAYAVTVWLACLGVRRSEQRANDYQRAWEDIEDDLAYERCLKLDAIDERNTARDRLAEVLVENDRLRRAGQPRDMFGRFGAK